MSEHVFETVESAGRLGVVVDGAMAITGVTSQREGVVRCRDCAHARRDGWECWRRVDDVDEGFELIVSVRPDGFCAWGAREGEVDE